MDYQELLHDTQLLHNDLEKTLADKQHNMVRVAVAAQAFPSIFTRRASCAEPVGACFLPCQNRHMENPGKSLIATESLTLVLAGAGPPGGAGGRAASGHGQCARPH